MEVSLVVVPYDSGHFERRMGLGPRRILEAGLERGLSSEGHGVTTTEIRIDMGLPVEVGMAIESQRRVAAEVAAALDDGRFPLILAGNCATALGTVAAVGSRATGSRATGPRATGVVWLDSHGDFNTPDTSRSGFFDGMVLAMMAGDCWREAAATVPGFEPVDQRNVVLVGVRDVDPAEESRLRGSGVQRIDVEAIRRDPRAALGQVLDELATRVDQVYFHIDLDVLDPSIARINDFQAPDGLRVEEIIRTIAEVRRRLPIVAAALTAYDPGSDRDGAGREAAARLALALASGD